MSVYMKRRRIIEAIEEEFDEPVSDVLLGFADMGYSLHYTAKVIGVHYNTLKRMSREYGITFQRNARPQMSEEHRRKLSEAKFGKGRSKFYTVNGKTKCQAVWARELGITESALAKRINVFGWDIEKALTTKKQKPRQRVREIGEMHPWMN